MSNRVLEVLEAVAVFGPASLDEICDKLPRTRSSVYRSLKVLEIDGWIRRSLNGRSFQISCRMEKLSEGQTGASDNITDIIDTLRNKLKNQRLLLTIASHIKGDEFEIIDSNTFPIPKLLECPYRRDMLSDLVTAISIGGNRTLLQRSAWLNENSKLREISTKISEEGYLISTEFEMGLLPILVDSGELIIVVLENKSHSITSLGRIQETLRDFAECLKQRNVSLLQNDESKSLLAG
jgi:predicted transcriptional regulator